MFALFWKGALSVCIGIGLVIAFSSYFDISYDTVGSLDIFTGAIIEFFIFTLLLNLFHTKQQEIYKRELSNHLNEIEKLLR